MLIQSALNRADIYSVSTLELESANTIGSHKQGRQTKPAETI